jgi:hypothetical protein
MEDLINGQPEQDIEHCATCIHADDSEDICILRRCKYAIAELKDCYEPKRRWIPFKTRPLTEEEKEEHPEWDCILDCKLPDDGQSILVTIRIGGHKEVQQDEFYSDDGSYLDSGYEIGTEAIAWMPLPKPYKEDGHD